MHGSLVTSSLVRETNLHLNDFVYPLFVVYGKGVSEEIESLPGNYHYSIDLLLKECKRVVDLGLKSILLFGIPESKDEEGSSAWASDGIVQQAVRRIKKEFPHLEVITDVCLCAYTSHGHCGVIKGSRVDNDATLARLKKVALSHAEAGADMVAPSDMMDGRIGVIRQALDENDYHHTGIMSYSAKYSSSFYGPFREAANSAPDFGDRSGYQMDPANSREALQEVKYDIQEGADIVMVKPALSFLDIIYRVQSNFNVPLAAYNVSGEYSLVHSGAQQGLCNREEMMVEILTSIKRAGADIIITYYAPQMAELLQS
ncbi:MAG: porphobilinogen synthase [Bacillota bacterium]